MIDFIKNFSYFELTIFGGLLAYLSTALGASLVFFFKNTNKILINVFLGFSAGIMLAASIWSLIIPAIEIEKKANNLSFLPVTFGILIGAFFIFLTEKIINFFYEEEQKNNKIKKIVNYFGQKNLLFLLAIFIHNLPEGLIIGISFGSLNFSHQSITLTSAFILTLAIALQDFPEGIASSFPLRNNNKFTPLKSFFFGQLSGLIEPIGAIMGYFFVNMFQMLNVYLLGFAAGAMLYVIFKELIPSSQSEKTAIGTFATIFGFLVMMILDIFLN